MAMFSRVFSEIAGQNKGFCSMLLLACFMLLLLFVALSVRRGRNCSY